MARKIVDGIAEYAIETRDGNSVKIMYDTEILSKMKRRAIDRAKEKKQDAIERENILKKISAGLVLLMIALSGKTMLKKATEEYNRCMKTKGSVFVQKVSEDFEKVELLLVDGYTIVDFEVVGYSGKYAQVDISLVSDRMQKVKHSCMLKQSRSSTNPLYVLDLPKEKMILPKI